MSTKHLYLLNKFHAKKNLTNLNKHFKVLAAHILLVCITAHKLKCEKYSWRSVLKVKINLQSINIAIRQEISAIGNQTKNNCLTTLYK